MADQPKKYELSGEYYSHKRSSLLASAIFMALSLPGIDLSNFSFVGIKLADKGHLLVPSFAGMIAGYYLLHYFFIWRTETTRHARSEISEVSEITDLLAAASKRMAEVIELLAARAEPLKLTQAQIASAQSYPAFLEIAQSIDHSEHLRATVRGFVREMFENVVVSDPLFQGWRSANPNSYQDDASIDQASDALMTILNDARKSIIYDALGELEAKRPDLFILVPPYDYAVNAARETIPAHMPVLQKAQKDLKQALKTFQDNQRSLWFRTSVLDWWVPAGVFAVAVGLFVNAHFGADIAKAMVAAIRH